MKNLICYSNRLTNLQGCPPSVKELECDDNNITDLTCYLPLLEDIGYEDNPLNNYWINMDKQQIIEELRKRK